MGFLDWFGVGSGLAKVTLTPIAGRNEFLEKEAFLTDELTKNVINDLWHYKFDLNTYPSLLSDYVRNSQNYINKSTAELKNYRKIIAECVKKLSKYKDMEGETEEVRKVKDPLIKKLNNSLKNLKAINEYIIRKKYTRKELNDKYKELNERFTFGANKRTTPSPTDAWMIGDYATNLNKVCLKIGNGTHPLHLLSILGVVKEQVSDHKYYKPKISDKASQLVSKVVRAALTSTGDALQSSVYVDPIENIWFNEDKFLGSSYAHSVITALNSYDVALNSYPKSLADYVSESKKYIKEIVSLLTSYRKILEIFKKTKISISDLQKTKAAIMANFKSLYEKNIEIIKGKFNEDYVTKKLQEFTSNGSPIDVSGLMLVEFAQEFNKVVKYSSEELDKVINLDYAKRDEKKATQANVKIDYDKLEMKAVKVNVFGKEIKYKESIEGNLNAKLNKEKDKLQDAVQKIINSTRKYVEKLTKKVDGIGSDKILSKSAIGEEIGKLKTEFTENTIDSLEKKFLTIVEQCKTKVESIETLEELESKKARVEALNKELEKHIKECDKAFKKLKSDCKGIK